MAQSRKIKAKKNISSSRGYSLSRKVGDMIPWESTIEKDFIKLLEFDPNVEYYESQPLVINYAFKGKVKEYYPDFKVVTKDNYVRIYEVKDSRQKKLEENIIKYKVGEQYCLERKWTYHVITEEDIRHGFLLDNLNDIYDVIDHPRNTNIERKIINTLMKHKEASIKQLQEEHQDVPEEIIFVYVYQLLFHHYIETDLINSKLTSNSIIKLKKKWLG
jgi:hypothetical protein